MCYNPNMYKLIATDLDGTLLNDSGELPEVNKHYIHKIMKSGIHVALCSGRSYVSLAKFEKILGLNRPGCYGICFNGGIVYDAFNKEIISDIRMSRCLALELVNEIKRTIRNLELGLVLYSGVDLYVERVTEIVSSYANKSEIPLTTINSFNEISQDITKLLIRGENPLLREVYEKMHEAVAGKCRMYFTAENLLEFIPLNSGKARGLQILAEKLNIPINETIAVGDQVNDIDMIKAAGLGIAVANAVVEVKKAAGYITRADNNSGVIKEIAQHFIGVL